MPPPIWFVKSLSALRKFSLRHELHLTVALLDYIISVGASFWPDSYPRFAFTGFWTFLESVGASLNTFSYRRSDLYGASGLIKGEMKPLEDPHAKLKNEQNADCRKRGKEVFNHLCNYMKMRDLACEKFGRKCCKKIEIMFVIQKFLLPLQPNNWGPLRPTSWYSIS